MKYLCVHQATRTVQHLSIQMETIEQSRNATKIWRGRACMHAHITTMCVVYASTRIYIYITYIHNHIYIYIYHIHECVNAHVSQANALLKLNTRPLKKTLFKRSCSIRNWMKMALFWLKSQFHPISASSFHNSNPKFCGWNPHWKGPENGWNRPNIPGFFPRFFHQHGGPSISASFEATDAFGEQLRDDDGNRYVINT